MVDKRPGPGVQDTQDPEQAPHILWVCGELDERVRRGTEQDVVQVFLVSTYKVPQLLGQGQDDMKVGDRQEFLPSLFQPRLGVLVVALRRFYEGTATGSTALHCVFLDRQLRLCRDNIGESNHLLSSADSSTK